ncbi:hypothetical protein HRUBRA_02869 [Pseudohaliea rubra DSM 19751]|uniref:Uncharacterized protein n=1 Tax=Pseudohaliea rubra DSM 19751 TaxID=1265313 RepID=A0A095WVF1_9GAMM|nr:hypothetical protein HRUBRA_02869 [Pseudohaliea rubra DSM 19751]
MAKKPEVIERLCRYLHIYGLITNEQYFDTLSSFCATYKFEAATDRRIKRIVELFGVEAE